MRQLTFLSVLVLANCGGCKKTPPGEVAPANLADVGIVLDGPEEGATVRGRWISVSGWVDPTEVALMSVVGAPVDGFYEATGHLGVPSVAVTLRKDGRFLAPRVPVAEGSNRISVVALSHQGRALNPVHRNVTATDVNSIPATVVADPEQGKPGVGVRLRASTGTAAQRTWQWDFDGDGTFDEESLEANHTWAEPGRYLVVARAQVDGVWVYGATRFTVASEAAVVHSTHEVSNPTWLRVFGNEDTPPADRARPTSVVAIDGSQVKIFDADLRLLHALNGLTKPAAVLLDEAGGALVLDVGAGAIFRYDAAGIPDIRFGTNGKITGATPAVLAAAQSMSFMEREVLVDFPSGAWRTLSLRGNGADAGATLSEEEPYQPPLHDCGFRPPFGANHSVQDGKICRTSRPVMRKGVTFVDYVNGPDSVVGDFWALDTAGKLYLYRTGRDLEGIWALEYAVTAIDSGPDGRLYTAGPGVIEQRSLPILRSSANQ